MRQLLVKKNCEKFARFGKVIDTFCKETVLYFPTNLRGNYSPEEAWGKLAKGCGDYSRRKPGGSPRRAAATTPGGSLGEARRGSRRLLLETLPEVLRDPAQTFAGRYCLEANWGKGHKAPSNEILQFPWVFPHFGQKSWGPPHGF